MDLDAVGAFLDEAMPVLTPHLLVQRLSAPAPSKAWPGFAVMSVAVLILDPRPDDAEDVVRVASAKEQPVPIGRLDADTARTIAFLGATLDVLAEAGATARTAAGVEQHLPTDLFRVDVLRRPELTTRAELRRHLRSEDCFGPWWTDPTPR